MAGGKERRKGEAGGWARIDVITHARSTGWTGLRIEPTLELWDLIFGTG